MKFNKQLNKIEQDIAKGLKLKAVNRLRSLVNDYPNELAIRERLAELYYDSGFLDAAGKYWLLTETEPEDEKIKKCVELYEKSVNQSGTQILNELAFRGDKLRLPQYAQDKLTSLEKDSMLRSNYIPTFIGK